MAPISEQPISRHAEVPTLLRRFAALMVDWVLCLLFTSIFADATRSLWPLPVLTIEYAFFIGLFAQTPGMALARIRCVAHRDGAYLGVPRAALRGALLCLVVPALLLDGERRGLHDRLAGSIVVAA